jgi:hypothetical protein
MSEYLRTCAACSSRTVALALCSAVRLAVFGCVIRLFAQKSTDFDLFLPPPPCCSPATFGGGGEEGAKGQLTPALALPPFACSASTSVRLCLPPIYSHSLISALLSRCLQVSTRRMVDDGAIEMRNVFVLTPFWSSHPERLRVSAAHRNLIAPCGNQEKVMEQGGLKALVPLATRAGPPRMAITKRGVSDYNGRDKTHRIGAVKREQHIPYHTTAFR